MVLRYTCKKFFKIKVPSFIFVEWCKKENFRFTLQYTCWTLNQSTLLIPFLTTSILVCITPNYFFSFLTIINNVKWWCSQFFLSCLYSVTLHLSLKFLIKHFVELSLSVPHQQRRANQP